MTLFFILVFSSYVLLMLILLFGWARLWEEKHTDHPSSCRISVIVPFRNESRSLPALLESIRRQKTLPFELILVDDHSQDDSLQIANDFAKSVSFATVISLVEDLGKKAALRVGISRAQGEWIATTDADCVVPEEWLSSVSKKLSTQPADMWVGALRFSGSGTFANLQRLEYSAILGLTGATLGLGFPVMCSGANLFFKKTSFDYVKGYEGNEHIASGDDEFLRRKFMAQGMTIRFLSDDQSTVTTSAQATLPDFLNQRIRWASKWKLNREPVSRWMALYFFLFHICFLVLVASSFFDTIDGKIVLALILAKAFSEALLLFAVNNFLKERWRWFPFLLLQFSYSFYVVGVAILSFRKTFKWKGREVGVV